MCCLMYVSGTVRVQGIQFLGGFLRIHHHILSGCMVAVQLLRAMWPGTVPWHQIHNSSVIAIHRGHAARGPSAWLLIYLCSAHKKCQRQLLVTNTGLNL